MRGVQVFGKFLDKFYAQIFVVPSNDPARTLGAATNIQKKLVRDCDAIYRQYTCAMIRKIEYSTTNSAVAVTEDNGRFFQLSASR
ncbi:hypothetical protein [Fodinicurvata sp. EGI_FJ10296]|uniref:hypothetical protein n=1 Tax=Fodinicurvata sp. EGI_FJ10296 TaxID=3231908 RepID=UPI0034563DDB